MVRLPLWSSVLSLMFSFEEQVLSWQSSGKKKMNKTLYKKNFPPSGNIMSVANYKAKYKVTDLLKFYDPHSFLWNTDRETVVVLFCSFWLREPCCVVGGWVAGVCILCLSNLMAKEKGFSSCAKDFYTYRYH